MAKKPTSTLGKLLPDWAFDYARRRPMTRYNPTKTIQPRQEPENVIYTLFRYNAAEHEERRLDAEDCFRLPASEDAVTWINIDGLKRAEVEKLGQIHGIHHLMLEDILSVGQRAKMDEGDNVFYCLLPMLYYNQNTGVVEVEQVSIVCGRNFVLSFQEDPARDVFEPIRQRIRNGQSSIRQAGADYLCYSIVDVIVDSYFNIIEKLNERVERLEDGLLLGKGKPAFTKMSLLRREVMMLRRSVLPVRDVVWALVRSEHPLLVVANKKYYRDVLDHIIQANEYIENHREMLMNLQDLSMSQVNLRTTEVMKVFTLLATLMAPATVIGGIFGMNFDVIPLAHYKAGFYFAVFVMLAIPLLMLIYFKRKGWF